MKILMKIERHVYAEDRLHDEILDESLGDDIDSCGIIGPEIILPLRKNSNPKLLFEYTENTTIQEVVNAVYNEFGFLDLAEVFYPRVAFFSGNVR